jgi:hypothetical protein
MATSQLIREISLCQICALTFLLRQGKIGEALLLSMGQYLIGSLHMELPIFAGIAHRPIISIWRLSEILEKVS